MADTTNFGWTKPTVGSNNGTWGSLLNTLFDDIDTDLQAVKDTADANDTALANLLTSKATGTATTVPTGIASPQALVFDTEIFDDIGGFDTAGANPERFTAPGAGKYMVMVEIRTASGLSVGTDVLGYLYKNGALTGIEGLIFTSEDTPSATSWVIAFHGTTIMDLAQNDYLELRFAHDEGTDVNFDHQMTVYRLS